MKKITLIFIILISVFSFGQTRKNSFKLSPASSHELYVSFSKEIKFESSDYTKESTSLVPDIKDLVLEYDIQLERGIAISEEKLIEMEAAATVISGKASNVSKLRNIFKIKIQNPSNSRLLELAGKLEKLNAVEYCSLVSLEPIKPPADILPVTSNLEASQTYINANPGVNMQYAWGLGQTGAGIKIRDVEYGLNKNHEEFIDTDANIATGMTINSTASTAYTEHGTCVFGIVYADKGTYGVSGMAYGADEMILFPEWQQTGYNRIFAISQSIANSVVGDVIIYEMQTGGQNDEYVCAEYDNVVWDLTLAASDTGIIIVAAAGNGSENLDAPFYEEFMNRGDSGAIIVGAGTSNMLHNKLSFSTYGSRVDVQAWGQNVYTTGQMPPEYGTGSYLISNDFNQSYSTAFSGTSAATPIVASCVVVLQSYYHSLTNEYLTGPELRAILIDTGIAQGNVASGSIGPIPNMQAAMQEIYNQYLLKNQDFKITEFTVFPNPAEDKITVKSSSQLSSDANIEIYNSLGQIVYAKTLNENKEIDIGNLSIGFYLVKVNDKGFVSTKKIVKK